MRRESRRGSQAIEFALIFPVVSIITSNVWEIESSRETIKDVDPTDFAMSLFA